MSVPLKDRIRAEYATLQDNFTNMIRASKIHEEHTEIGRGQARVPGQLVEVFSEKMIHSFKQILDMTRELKHLVMLNTVAERNEEVSNSREDLEKQAEAIKNQLR